VALFDIVTEFVVILIVVALLDAAAYWKMANWSRQFSGKSPSFTYAGTIFPRGLFTFLGCVTFLFAKHSQDIRGIMFSLSVMLIGGSNLYLYYKLIKARKSPDR